MAVERTLSIIKPDAVAKNVIGEILARFEKAGLKIVAARMAWLSRAEAEGFYAVHRERPFFRDLVDFMISGPVMIQVLEGENAIARNRELMGATDPEEGGRRARSAPISRSRSTPTPCTARTRRRRPRVEIAYFFPALAVTAARTANGIRASHRDDQPARPRPAGARRVLRRTRREAVSRAAGRRAGSTSASPTTSAR